RIVERAFAVHLEIRNERVPVRHAAPTRPRVEIDARETECGRSQCRGRLPVATERFAVENELGIELPRTPRAEHGSNRVGIGSEQRRQWIAPRCERDDLADTEIAIRPA